MKKLNLINVFLFIFLILFCFYDEYKTKKNLAKIETALITNYNELNYQQLIDENQNLNKLLALKNSKLNTIAVKATFINMYEELIINKGTSSKIANNMAVINDKRLIGFIRNAKENYSNVELLENLNKKISIKVNDNYGFLESKNNKLIITGINNNAMNINDDVYTSGLTDIPGNIYIGKISEISEKDETFETKACVKIDDNYEDYKYLLVVHK